MFNLAKKIAVFTIALLLVSSFSNAQNEEQHNIKMDQSTKSDLKLKDGPTGIKTSDGILYGKDYDASMPVMGFGDLLNKAEENNDKVVLVKGTITEVCQAMGCWVVITEGAKSVRVKTLDEFFVPKDVAGRDAVVIGKFKVTEISEEMAKHYNEESKNPPVKTEDIKGTQKVYEIDATGIKILNPSTDTNKN